MFLSFIDRAKRQYYKLVLIIGNFGLKKSKFLLKYCFDEGLFYYNLNLELSKRLIGIPSDHRISSIETTVGEVLQSNPGNSLVLDHIELLYVREFCLQPLQLLKTHSRNKVIIVAWNGEYDGKKLTYGKSGDEEYQEYVRDELKGIEIVRIEDLE